MVLWCCEKQKQTQDSTATRAKYDCFLTAKVKQRHSWQRVPPSLVDKEKYWAAVLEDIVAGSSNGDERARGALPLLFVSTRIWEEMSNRFAPVLDYAMVKADMVNRRALLDDIVGEGLGDLTSLVARFRNVDQRATAMELQAIFQTALKQLAVLETDLERRVEGQDSSCVSSLILVCRSSSHQQEEMHVRPSWRGCGCCNRLLLVRKFG